MKKILGTIITALLLSASLLMGGSAPALATPALPAISVSQVQSAPAVAKSPSIQQAGNLGIRPMVCIRKKVKALPWYHPACINLFPGKSTPIQCRDHWEIVC